MPAPQALAPFTIHHPAPTVAVPLVIHVPHAADVIPPHYRADFVLGSDDLREVIAALIDHDTDRLALAAVSLGAHVFVNEVCRLVVEPERFPDDADEPAAIHGLGAVYVNAHDGRRLRRPDWSAADRSARMEEFYHPYHRAMRDLVLELRERFEGPVHIIDLHSFPEQPLPYETGLGPRPRYCLGWTEAHVPRDWLAWWDARATDVPGLVAHNRPFAGAFVPDGLPAEAMGGVRSLMVEVNRSLLPAWPQRPPLPSAHERAGLVREFFEFACGDVRRQMVDPSTTRRCKSAPTTEGSRP